MAFVNLPPNLQDMFYALSDRIAKLETGPNQPGYDADAAQTSANSASSAAAAAYAQAISAQTQANSALNQASIAYAQAVSSLKPSAYVISNATQQITSIATNGVTVYSGSSPSSGARVTMNSLGLAGYDSSGSATFSISASTGAANFAGSITGSTITGSTLNISGNFIVDSSGYLTATGATVTGSITATSGSFTGSIYASTGTVGGWNLGTDRLYASGSTYLQATTGNIATVGNITAGGNISTSIGSISSATSVTALSSLNGGTLGITGSGTIGTSLQVGTTLSVLNGAIFYSTVYANTLGTTTSGLPVYQVQSGGNAGYLKAYTSAERFKTNITPISPVGYASIIQNITPVTYDDIEDPTQKDIPGLIAEHLAKVKGMNGLVVYDSEGQTMGINYEKLGIMIILALKELDIENRLNKLEGK